MQAAARSASQPQYACAGGDDRGIRFLSIRGGPSAEYLARRLLGLKAAADLGSPEIL